MTATEAKSITLCFGEPREGVILALRECFDRAIANAAHEKKWCIYMHEVPKLRTPVTPVEIERVYQLLRQDGFIVTDTQVIWS